MEPALDPSQDQRRRGSVTLLAAALFLGLARFWQLGSFGIWYDEALTWAAHERLIEFEPWTYPLWYPAVRATALLTGGSLDAFTLRLLPATMGFVGVLGTYWAMSPLAGRRVAAAAALVLAASPWHYYLSQTARPYTSALALSILGAGLVLRGLTGHRRWQLPAGLALAATAALFHPTALIGVAGLAAAAWSERRRGGLPRPLEVGALALVLLAGAAVLPWLQELAEVTLFRADPGPLHFALAYGYYLEPLVLTGALVGLLQVLRERDRFGLFALLAAGVMVAAALALSCFVRITARYVLWSLPWVAALASLPVGGPAPEPRRRDLRWAYLALLVLPQLPQLVLYHSEWNGNRPRWREAYQLVDRLREPGDVILGHADLVGWYYLGAPEPGRRLSVTAIQSWRRVLEEDLGPDERAWFVVRREELREWPETEPEVLLAFLRERCRLVETFLLVPTMGRNLTLDVFVTSP